MVQCRECKATVADTAEKCPHCGVDYPNKRLHVGAMIVGIIVLVLSLIVVFWVWNTVTSAWEEAGKRMEREGLVPGKK
jgi:hypothetical protein